MLLTLQLKCTTHRFRLCLLLLPAALLTGCALAAQHATASAPTAALPEPTIVFDDDRPLATDDSPNILLIITDDQRYDTIDYMPTTKASIFDQGLTFTRAYVTTPNCCPSRSSILTGLYTSHHNVWHNGFQLEMETFVQTLHTQGYLTGVVGKYLNSYPVEDDDARLPEFDFWVAHGSLQGNDYTDYNLHVGDEVVRSTEYLTHVERDYALSFLDQAGKQSERPFFLLFAPHAPHAPATPAPGDESLYADLPPYRPTSFNEADMSDKPAWLQDSPTLTDRQIKRLDQYRLNQLRTLHAVDEAIFALLDRLEEQDRLYNTVVIFLSDNGDHWGEHRLKGKNTPYEPSIHVPLAIHYPAMILEPRTDDHLIANIDIAPTLYDLVNVEPPYALDGLSLLPLLAGEEVPWRDSLLIESWRPTLDLMYSAVHTGDTIYIETRYHDGDIDKEFYDLRIDPEQLDNRADDPQLADIIEEIAALLPWPRPDWPAGPASEND